MVPTSQSLPLLKLAVEKEVAEMRRNQMCEGKESQLHMILQDMYSKYTLNEPELDELAKRLKAVVRGTQVALYDSAHGSFDSSLCRFIVAYKSPSSIEEKAKCQALHMVSASPTPNPVSVTVHTPVNTAFSGTYVKTVISGLTRRFGVAVISCVWWIMRGGTGYTCAVSVGMAPRPQLLSQRLILEECP